MAERYRSVDESGRRFWANTMTAAEPRKNPSRVFRGQEMMPPPGTHWRFLQSEIDRLEAEGGIYYSKSGMPYVKSYLDQRKGRPSQNLWTDIVLSKSGAERLGYPTQKPVALLERVIEATSNLGDVVLDPFCGCGTALIAAQKRGREWIGIDVTYLSIAVMRARLKDSLGLPDVEVVGQPTEVDGAKAMLVGTGLEGQYQFQWWALDLIGAQPQGGTPKKGADKGIDGVISFSTGPHGEVGRALVSVRSGSVNSSMVRDLVGVLDREKAEIGIFVTLHEPSGPMKQEATIAGTYHSDLSGKDYPRVQLLSIKEILEGHRKPELPLLVLSAYQKAPKIGPEAPNQRELFGS